MSVPDLKRETSIRLSIENSIQKKLESKGKDTDQLFS